ncbi:hypothetical protein CDV55_104106 [Aspergillus turcosus]|uniref:F-box domain-containing protein n=1 Tax=Aspergillus turcosus TaxID=1245748 RepID=A0A229X1H3_9EURO|nr:hypothetical protein CDV55_104106 [Aspergillus turcosus]RLL94429.1 hypothetical protein CFD26_100543 [Aspergillus turcosus]
MALLTLPNEILQLVITDLDVPRDLNTLARSSRSFYEIFNPWMYLDELTRDGGYSIIVYAAQMGHAGTIQRLLQFSTNNTTQEELKLDATGFSHGFTRSYLGKAGTYSHDGWSPLAWAAVRGDEDVMKLLLRIEGVDVDVKCPQGRTPLSFAAENGHVGIARLLLAAGANPNTQDAMYRTPLHWAGSPVLSGDPRGITDPYSSAFLDSKSKSLIYCPVKIYFQEDIAGSYGWNRAEKRGQYCTQCAEALDLDAAAPLTSISSSWSAGPAYKDILNILIQYGANLELPDGQLRTPLCWAATCGYESLVKLLLDKRACTYSSSKHQRTALSWAAENGNTAIVQTLIDWGCPVLLPGDNYETSALSFAAMKGHYDTVQLLARKTVIREIWNSGDRSADWAPLVWAAVGGHARVVELLLEIHATKWPKDPIGSTAVCWAACRGHTEIIQLLMTAGAEMTCLPARFDLMTPLQLAAKNKHADTVEYLLATEKVDVNAVDSFGWTALTWAAGHSRQRNGIKQILLDHGADPSFEKSRREVMSPPHFIVRNETGCQLVDITTWPSSFKIDWESLSQGKRMRDIPDVRSTLCLTQQMMAFEGWSYNRPSPHRDELPLDASLGG